MIRFLFLIVIVNSLLFSGDEGTTNENSVNWFAWSEEVFDNAGLDDKLIFLSIDDVDCHWSYSMQEESFEDKKISTILNQDYMAITVNREDIENMAEGFGAVMNSLAGLKQTYPINMILTPKKEILFLKNYVPRSDGYGAEGMESVLLKMSKLYRSDKAKIKKLIKDNLKVKKPIKDDNLERDFVKLMLTKYDKKYKGFGKDRKYPLSSHLNLLFDIYLLTGDKDAFMMIDESLKAMANGGIYDQIDGGFFRYSTNKNWTTPNFEKTLYTSALMIPLYVKMFLITKNPLYKKVVLDTIEETDKRFLKGGLYFAASDAYSGGFEGGYFTYSQRELKNSFKQEKFTSGEIKHIFNYFGIVDGKNNLFVNKKIKKPKKYKQVIQIFKDIRSTRKFPKVDETVILSWNALMMKAKIIASVLDKKYLEDAKKSLFMIKKKFYIKDKLYNHSVGTANPTEGALFEDYSLYIDALLEIYQYTFDESYMDFATVLSAKAKKKFYINMIWYKDNPKSRKNSKYQNRYYTTALSKHFHNLLTMSSLNYSKVSLYNTRELLKDERESIVKDFFKSPEALKALIRVKHGDIILKSKAQKLKDNIAEIKRVHYPYVYMNSEEIEKFIGCDNKSCFSFEKELDNTLFKIDRKMLKLPYSKK